MVSLDGRAAYDTISRESFLTALQEVAPSLLPFVRFFTGVLPSIIGGTRQGRAERWSKGRAASKAILSSRGAVGQHAALRAAQARLHPEGEEVFAFLDDLYVLTTLAREARDVAAGEVEATCGVASNHGNKRIFGWSGPARGRRAGTRRVAREQTT